jgi:tetratricopeptide (TPR) repeat protein
MKRRRTLALTAGAALLLGVLSCSTAPAKNDTVTTMKNQAAQDAGYGEAYLRQGRYDLALQFFTLALNENTSIDNTEGIIKSYNSIGRVYMAVGSLDDAQSVFSKAQGLARGASAPLLFVTTNNLGELYMAQGDPQKALETFQEALAMPAEARTPSQTATLFHNLGTAQRNLGNPTQALEYYGDSLEINLANKLTAEAAADYYMIASVYSRRGSYDEAVKNALLALSLDKKIENSPGIAEDLYALGLISNKSKDTAGAYDYFQRSYLVYTTLSFKEGQKKALTELILAAESLGRTAEAESFRKTLSDLGRP